MKLVEIISQKLFIRTDDGVGYDITIEGDIYITYNNSCNCSNSDRISVMSDGKFLEYIDIPTQVNDKFYIKCYIEQGVDACIIIKKCYE